MPMRQTSLNTEEELGFVQSTETRHALLVVHGETDFFLQRACSFGGLQGSAAEERRVRLELTSEHKASFVGHVVDSNLLVPVGVSFLDAERVDGSVGSVDHPVFDTGLVEGMVYRNTGRRRNVQLPPHLAYEADPEGQNLIAGHGDGLAGRVGES
jgi:hypothetical protein